MVFVLSFNHNFDALFVDVLIPFVVLFFLLRYLKQGKAVDDRSKRDYLILEVSDERYGFLTCN